MRLRGWRQPGRDELMKLKDATFNSVQLRTPEFKLRRKWLPGKLLKNSYSCSNVILSRLW